MQKKLEKLVEQVAVFAAFTFQTKNPSPKPLQTEHDALES